MDTEAPVSARMAAINAGATSYTAKRACRRCGSHERYVVNCACVTCTRRKSADVRTRIKAARQAALENGNG